MGFLSDDEMEFEPVQSDPDTPPGSPRLAATHARAIADTYTSNNSEINTRVLRDYASLCCEELGLTDVDKDDVLRTSQMNPHLIAVRQYARVVALTHNVNRLLTESFLESAEFKDHVTRRIQATFLDADIPTYVRGCTARLIQHMQENPASWYIPPVVHAHFVNSKAFRKAVAAIASNARGDMRRKIKKSITDNSDIGAFAKKLCVKGYQPTVGHWRRFALLRCYMRDWEKLPVKPGKGRGMSYWAFIDTKLDKLRSQCAKPTEKETQKEIKDMLKGNLKDDQSRYKGPTSGATKLPAKIHLPEWQQDHAQAVKDMSAYTVDASVDDDIDDDDSTTDTPGAGVPLRVDAAMEDRGHDGDTEEDLGSSCFDPLAQSADAHVRDARTGRVLVPETQETLREARSGSEPALNQGASTEEASGSSIRVDTQGSNGSFVPETQLRSIETQQGGAEDRENSAASGNTSGRTTRSGGAVGSLVERRLRPSHTAASPLARTNPSPASRSR